MRRAAGRGHACRTSRSPLVDVGFAVECGPDRQPPSPDRQGRMGVVLRREVQGKGRRMNPWLTGTVMAASLIRALLATEDTPEDVQYAPWLTEELAERQGQDG